MRKPQTIGHHTGRPSIAPSNWAPIALFTLAYLAVLAVLFAPEGYFLSEPATAVSAD
jgi:hypothetical protein